MSSSSSSSSSSPGSSQKNPPPPPPPQYVWVGEHFAVLKESLDGKSPTDNVLVTWATNNYDEYVPVSSVKLELDSRQRRRSGRRGGGGGGGGGRRSGRSSSGLRSRGRAEERQESQRSSRSGPGRTESGTEQKQEPSPKNSIVSKKVNSVNEKQQLHKNKKRSVSSSNPASTIENQQQQQQQQQQQKTNKKRCVSFADHPFPIPDGNVFDRLLDSGKKVESVDRTAPTPKVTTLVTSTTTKQPAGTEGKPPPQQPKATSAAAAAAFLATKTTSKCTTKDTNISTKESLLPSSTAATAAATKAAATAAATTTTSKYTTEDTNISTKESLPPSSTASTAATTKAAATAATAAAATTTKAATTTSKYTTEDTNTSTMGSLPLTSSKLTNGNDKKATAKPTTNMLLAPKKKKKTTSTFETSLLRVLPKAPKKKKTPEAIVDTSLRLSFSKILLTDEVGNGKKQKESQSDTNNATTTSATSESTASEPPATKCVDSLSFRHATLPPHSPSSSTDNPKEQELQSAMKAMSKSGVAAQLTGPKSKLTQMEFTTKTTRSNSLIRPLSTSPKSSSSPKKDHVKKHHQEHHQGKLPPQQKQQSQNHEQKSKAKKDDDNYQSTFSDMKMAENNNLRPDNLSSPTSPLMKVTTTVMTNVTATEKTTSSENAVLKTIPNGNSHTSNKPRSIESAGTITVTEEVVEHQRLGLSALSSNTGLVSSLADDKPKTKSPSSIHQRKSFLTQKRSNSVSRSRSKSPATTPTPKKKKLATKFKFLKRRKSYVKEIGSKHTGATSLSSSSYSSKDKKQNSDTVGIQRQFVRKPIDRGFEFNVLDFSPRRHRPSSELDLPTGLNLQNWNSMISTLKHKSNKGSYKESL